LNYLRKTFPEYRFILFGDDKQLAPIVGDVINITEYSYERLSKVYRQTDEAFVQELEDVYETGKPMNLPPIEIKEAIGKGAVFACCINKYVDQINEVAYEMSTGTVINKTLKAGMPAYVDNNNYRRKFGVSKNEMCTIIDEKHVEIAGQNYAIPASSCKSATAITCHKLQGQTIDKMLVVYTRGIHCFGHQRKNMLYTMYTRVRERGQLYKLDSCAK
jgi:hypothetical protein